ncbi:YrhC-like protein [Lentibacillus halodurans]|uniref:YrhC-like protein n=1 Tax=Lentibacillus halodurans TaxID=237679 RepID=A0A1I0V258_9BACI|nr:YrhC family protein [Lentibacillus halodurans]SFA69646.1 YrhC-like protein [Lentibacillus halodurans]
MKAQEKKLESKLKDYHRFAVTLLILGTYLYMGAIINTYFHYSPDGKGLSVLSFAAIIMAGWFHIRTHHIKIKQQE